MGAPYIYNVRLLRVNIEVLVRALWVMLGLNLVLCTASLDRFSKPFVQVQMG